MAILKEVYHVLLFTLKEKWVFLLSLIAVLLMPTLAEFKETWNDKVEVATFFVTLFLLYKSMKDEWKETLPLRLNVTFTNNDKKVMVAESVYLAHEADVRNWTQQTGSQMSGDRLEFDLVLTQEGPIVKFDVVTDKPYKLYTCQMNLTLVPSKIAASFNDGYYLRWVYAFDGKSKQCFQVKHDGSESIPCLIT
jgi:hypothetical protein